MLQLNQYIGPVSYHLALFSFYSNITTNLDRINLHAIFLAVHSQPAITCSKLTLNTLEQGPHKIKIKDTKFPKFPYTNFLPLDRIKG